MNKTYYWRVRSENKMGVSNWSETWSFTTSSPTSVREENVPEEFSLYQNYPNPFNPETKIKYTMPSSSIVTLKVYDVLGNEITTLVNKEKQPGIYEVEFNASNFSSGIYIYRLQTGSFIETKKMMLLK